MSVGEGVKWNRMVYISRHRNRVRKRLGVIEDAIRLFADLDTDLCKDISTSSEPFYPTLFPIALFYCLNPVLIILY